VPLKFYKEIESTTPLYNLLLNSIKL